MNKTCFLFGEENIKNQYYLKDLLYRVVEQKIFEGCDRFLIGTRGDFNKMAIEVCKTLKKIYFNIRICIVYTNHCYFNEKYIPNSKSKFYEFKSYPVTDAPHIYRLILCNRYMSEEGDVAVCFVDQNFNNVENKTLTHIKLLKKPYINLFKYI